MSNAIPAGGVTLTAADVSELIIAENRRYSVTIQNHSVDFVTIALDADAVEGVGIRIPPKIGSVPGVFVIDSPNPAGVSHAIHAISPVEAELSWQEL